MNNSVGLSRRSAEEQHCLEVMLKDLFEQRIRFNAVLGLRVVSFALPAPSIAFDMHPELVGNYVHGRLHGGVISAALDAVAGFAVMLCIAEKFSGESAEQLGQRFTRLGTIDLRTDYLHQGFGRTFTAVGRVTRLGGRIASVQMTLENENGVLIATGSAAYVVS